nr:DNA-directed DNA polymerase [Tanacetum cinerariifolium]
MARIDAMTLNMDAQYKELQSSAKKAKPDLDEDDIPMSREEEAKFMQTFRKTRFYNDYRDRDSNHDNWRSNERSSYKRENYRSNTDDKSYDLQKQFNDFIKSQQSTNTFVKETFMNLKTKLETVAKNHQASIQNLETKFDRLADKQFGRPSGSLPSNTQPNPKGHNSKTYQPPQARNEHVNVVFTRSDITYNPPVNPNDQQDKFETPINFDSEDEDDEPTPQPKIQNPKPELISNKYKIEQISAALLSDESSAMIQNKVPPKLGDPGSFLIPCNFNKAFSCNALANLGASINLMPYSLYTKLSFKTLKPTKMSVRLADRSFQYPVGITENMLVEVGKFTFLVDFVILEMKEDSKVPLILGRPFLHTADAVIRVKHKQLDLGVGTERMIFNIDSAMKYSYSNDDTCFNIDVIDEILEEDFDSLLDEGSKFLHSIEGTYFEKEILAEFDEFMAMIADENSDFESDTEEPPFEKITINTDYKIKTSLEEPPTDLELKPLPDNLEYVFLEETSFLPVSISSQFSKEKKNKLISILKKHKQAFAWKATDIPKVCASFYNHKIQLLDDKKPVVQKQRRLNPNMQEVVKKEIIKLLDIGYFQIPIDPNDQEKTTFACPFGTYAYRRMPFGLCNAPATFQRCILAIFDNMIEESVKVFMDDSSVFGIVLGHKVSSTGLEVDKAKIDVISKLPPRGNIKGIRSFLGHVSFYRRFIKDFLKIARPLTKLLEKDTPFEFDDKCQKAFELLKEKLTCAPVIVSPNWNLPFKLMCDASDFIVGAILGQKDGKNYHPVYFESKTLNPSQQKYTVIEKELMFVVFAFEKFRSYLIHSKTIVHTDHSALRHLLKKQDVKPRLIRWILLLQEFDVEIKDRKGTKNATADHLSRIENDELRMTVKSMIAFPEKLLWKSIPKMNLGQAVYQDFDDLVYVKSMFGLTGFQYLLEINGQIIPRFILEFHSQYRFNYTLEGQMVIEFVIQDQLFSYTLKEFGQILAIPFREEREDWATRIRRDQVIDIEDNQILTREITSVMKTWIKIIRENVFCLGDSPSRPSNLLLLQSHPSLDITLSLSPITPLDHILDTHSPPSPSPPPPPQLPIMGHPIYFNMFDYHRVNFLCCFYNQNRILSLRDEMNFMFAHFEYLLTSTIASPSPPHL